MTLVIVRGQLPRIKPCMTKNTEPSPSMINVGIAIPSVSRVRIVTIAWGKYPRIIEIDATQPIIKVQVPIFQVFKIIYVSNTENGYEVQCTNIVRQYYTKKLIAGAE